MGTVSIAGQSEAHMTGTCTWLRPGEGQFREAEPLARGVGVMPQCGPAYSTLPSCLLNPL